MCTNEKKIKNYLDNMIIFCHVTRRKVLLGRVRQSISRYGGQLNLGCSALLYQVHLGAGHRAGGDESAVLGADKG